MKILILASSFNIGGAETSLVRFSNLLSSNHDVTICAIRKGPLMSKLNKNIKTLIIGRKSYVPFFKKINKLNAENFDLAINFHDWNYTAQRILNRVDAKRKLIWIHNNRMEELPSFFKFTYSNFGGRWKYNAIAVSEIAMNSHKALFKNKLTGRIKVIENLVETDWENHFKKNSIVNIARDAKVKNHDLMIKILKEWNHKKIEFNQFGVPKDSATAKKYSSINNPKVEIKLHGKSADMWKGFNTSALVMTSTVEGQPMVIAESMSRCVNVVATPFNTMKDDHMEKSIIRSKTFESNEIIKLIETSLDKPHNSAPVKKHQIKIEAEIKEAVKSW